MIPLGELTVGTVYRLRARNLRLGVWTGDRFIGIRRKFSDRFLDAEFEYSTHPQLGTARATAATGAIEPAIVLESHLGTVCDLCHEPADFDMDRPERERWHHVTDDSPLCLGGIPYLVGNAALFKALEALEATALDPGPGI